MIQEKQDTTELPDNSDSSRTESYEKFLRAKNENKLSSYYLKRFINYRDAYSNALPEKDVREIIQERPSIRYKCQKTYIRSLQSAIKVMKTQNIVTNPISLMQTNQFLDHNFNSLEGKFTSENELKLINTTLDVLIENLSSHS